MDNELDLSEPLIPKEDGPPLLDAVPAVLREMPTLVLDADTDKCGSERRTALTRIIAASSLRFRGAGVDRFMSVVYAAMIRTRALVTLELSMRIVRSMSHAQGQCRQGALGPPYRAEA